jgi:hypothetical protein
MVIKMKSVNEIIRIKNRNDDFKAYFERILDNKPDYIIISSFSFFLPPVLWNKFKNLSCPKLVIIPYEYEHRDGKNNMVKSTINQMKRIEQIINTGATVLVNSVNHAKYMLTEKDCFVGSNNLTIGGMVDNIENSHFMYNKSGDYQHWKDEIFKFINGEIKGFASLKRLHKGQKAIDSINIQELESWIISREELYQILNNMTCLKIALYSVNDCYQHIGSEVRELILETCPIIKDIDALVGKLEELHWNLYIEYENKKGNDNIYIKKRDVNFINSSILDINKNLQRLNLSKDQLLNKYKKTWRTNQTIYKYLTDKETDSNLKGLNQFINTVLR